MTRPCALAVLPGAPTRADLDVAYVMRGSQVASCDAARRLAVETLLAERALQDRWLEQERARSSGSRGLFAVFTRQD